LERLRVSNEKGIEVNIHCTALINDVVGKSCLLQLVAAQQANPEPGITVQQAKKLKRTLKQEKQDKARKYTATSSSATHLIISLSRGRPYIRPELSHADSHESCDQTAYDHHMTITNND